MIVCFEINNLGNSDIICFFSSEISRYKYSQFICSILKEVLSLNKLISFKPDNKDNMIKSASRP